MTTQSFVSVWLRLQSSMEQMLKQLQRHGVVQTLDDEVMAKHDGSDGSFAMQERDAP